MSQTDSVLDASKQIARFHNSYTINSTTQCWEWNLALSVDGYGRCYFNNVNVRAHRLSYELHYGTFPRHLSVCHKCDNPKCVNPTHLFLGTVQDNMKDKRVKGRSKGINRGVLNGSAKLSDEDVETIRHLATTNLYQWQIASIFNITQSHVCRILKGDRQAFTRNLS